MRNANTEETFETALQPRPDGAEPTALALTAQPPPDRFLIGIVVGLALLLLAAGVSVAYLRQPVRELPLDTPGGTIQRFYAALEQKDYSGAFDYLSDSMSKKPTREEFLSYRIAEYALVSTVPCS